MERLSPKAEEILESLWVATVEGHEVGCLLSVLQVAPGDEQLVELEGLAYVETRGERIQSIPVGGSARRFAKPLTLYH